MTRLDFRPETETSPEVDPKVTRPRSPPKRVFFESRTEGCNTGWERSFCKINFWITTGSRYFKENYIRDLFEETAGLGTSAQSYGRRDTRKEPF